MHVKNRLCITYLVGNEFKKTNTHTEVIITCPLFLRIHALVLVLENCKVQVTSYEYMKATIKKKFMILYFGDTYPATSSTSVFFPLE
jgi:hypothetical protein